MLIHVTAPLSSHTFLTPPTFRVALAKRERVLSLLRTGADCRVTLIEAPAGYGKTWLLARCYGELRASGSRVAWLGIEEADPAQFVRILAAGLARAGLDMGDLEVMSEEGFSGAPLPSAVRAICAALDSAGAPITIIVDDVHRAERGALQEILARLFTEAPPGTRFLCSGRDVSGLPRAALRARGELCEIGADDLRFDASEAAELLPQLARGQLDQLLEHTEGWPVALQLARLWLGAKPERLAQLDTFSGRTSEVGEYLTEQVLADLSADLKSALDDVAELDSLNADLVGAVTVDRDLWARLLGEPRLEHFLVPLDEERYWFRLHNLLLEHLRSRRRLAGKAAHHLHARASAWFERHGQVREAVRHAVLADEVARAAQLIERTGGWQLVLFGGTSLMRALLGTFPAEQLCEYPRIKLYHAYLLAKGGDLARGMRAYQEVADASREDTNPAFARDRLIVGHLIFLYADRPVGSNDLADVYRQYESLPANEEVARATLLNSACLLAFRIGAMPAALDACTRAVQEMRRIGSVLGVNYCLFHLGLAQLHCGERREAEATLREADSMAEENFGADSGLKAIAAVYLSLALHARGDIAGAAQKLSASLAQIETADGWLDLYAEGYEVAMANAIARGDDAGTREVIERMADTASRRGLARLVGLAAAFRAQTAALTMQGVESEATDDNVPRPAPALEWHPGAWRSTPSVWREHQAVGVAHVLEALATSRPDLASAILDDLESSAEAGGRIRQLRMLAALRGAVLVQLGRSEQAIGAFAPSLEASVSEDDTQFLVDLGPALQPLLQATWKWHRQHGNSARIRQVVAAAVTELGRLRSYRKSRATFTARELEVLGELASGAPNKVIARQLQMTENTVKFHLKRVFQKLQVRHRAEALQAARRRGLLP
ncbi:MAG TPA: LuxR C-terminal-related transcriptional regulator [Steroidobacteraceae bacterium]|nr:LuxR C-terminal-related transcriptional regulator [Steroidobacteraceae bacterium]